MFKADLVILYENAGEKVYRLAHAIEPEDVEL